LKPAAISLFSGAGGLDLGFEEAGFEIRLCVDIDAHCCKTLSLNRPHWKVVQADISKLSTSEILSRAGLSVGYPVLYGGPPCQPFSTIGNRRALDDPRGAVVRDYIRIVKESKPQIFVFENVPGLASVDHGKVLSEILAAFSGIGYSTNKKILNAANYGVPQTRKRLFILGSIDGFALDFPRGDYSEDGVSAKKWRTVRETMRMMKEEGWDIKRRDNMGFRHSEEMVKKMAMIKPGQNFWSLPLNLRPPCWRSGKHLGKDTFGRMELGKPAPTIRTCAYNPTKGKYIHPTENRGLNTLEMAALQTFPKNYHFDGGLIDVGRQIGDAVPPLLASRIAHQVKKQIAQGPSQQVLVGY